MEGVDYGTRKSWDADRDISQAHGPTSADLLYVDFEHPEQVSQHLHPLYSCNAFLALRANFIKQQRGRAVLSTRKEWELLRQL